MRLRSAAKGILSYAVPALRSSHVDSQSASAIGSYSLLLRHLVQLRAATGLAATPTRVAELGPGKSYGFGLAALLAGAERYYAFDVVDHGDLAWNLALIDALATLFARREPIPRGGTHSQTYPFLQDHQFPTELLSDDILARSLAPQRLEAIRDDLRTRAGRFIQVHVPWQDAPPPPDAQVDWIASQSVLEHVDDLAGAYARLAQWLPPGGVMSHVIDYSSHQLTSVWNGHWAISELGWACLRGRRHYLLNRLPHAHHVALLKACGFAIRDEQRLRRVDGLLPSRFASGFRDLAEEDAFTHLAFVACERVGS
jgi:SAM-dependent methyltransferase